MSEAATKKTTLKFSPVRFSHRKPELECATIVLHEPCVLGLPRATAAAVILPDDTVYVGVSVCAVGDQFVKSLGRNKALGRAFRSVVHGAPFGAALGPEKLPLIKALLMTAIAREHSIIRMEKERLRLHK